MKRKWLLAQEKIELEKEMMKKKQKLKCDICS